MVVNVKVKCNGTLHNNLQLLANNGPQPSNKLRAINGALNQYNTLTRLLLCGWAIKQQHKTYVKYTYQIGLLIKYRCKHCNKQINPCRGVGICPKCGFVYWQLCNKCGTPLYYGGCRNCGLPPNHMLTGTKYGRQGPGLNAVIVLPKTVTCKQGYYHYQITPLGKQVLALLNQTNKTHAIVPANISRFWQGKCARHNWQVKTY